MTLTQPQQRKVEQNLGLVGKVIKDKVHNPGQNSIYSYDDLYQIGCIGLCKAAYSDKGGCFSTYAYRLIWNEICTALIYANRRAAKECELIPEVLGKEDSLDEHHELSMILDRLEANASEAMAKGIRAIRLITIIACEYHQTLFRKFLHGFHDHPRITGHTPQLRYQDGISLFRGCKAENIVPARPVHRNAFLIGTDLANDGQPIIGGIPVQAGALCLQRCIINLIFGGNTAIARHPEFLF